MSQHSHPVAESSTEPFAVRDLGRLAYGPALAEQRRVNQAVIDNQSPPTVLLLEHEPVITVSQRRHARQNVIASADRLSRLGIEVQETDRGGDVTYHGPGQLVAYPILRLRPLGLNLSSYMRLLEQVVIDTLAAWQISGQRVEGATGVWVDPQAPWATSPSGHPLAKICAMGVRVRKNVTMHGLALNVQPDLSHFQTIIPCGLTNSEVTSLHQLLGENCPAMAQVKATLIDQLARACMQGPASA
jgi:lipoyl(octanoyl) transferase